MKSIQQWVLPAPGNAAGFDLPTDAKVVYVNVLGESAYIYAWVTSNRSITKRRFFAVVQSGWELPADAAYIGSFRDQRGIWHVIERVSGLH